MKKIARSRRFLVLATALATVAAVIVPVSAAAAAPSFDLSNCTIVGTSSADILTGTSGADVICGLGGADTINALGGDDIVWGGSGSDVLRGGDGDDILRGGGGNDEIRGNAGDDMAYGNAGRDRLFGGQGNDTIAGGKGQDELTGGSGDDILQGKSGDDILYGGGGADQLFGGSDNDSLFGQNGTDLLDGGTGSNDQVNGGQGTDICRNGIEAECEGPTPSVQIDSPSGGQLIDTGQNGTRTGGFFIEGSVAQPAFVSEVSIELISQPGQTIEAAVDPTTGKWSAEVSGAFGTTVTRSYRVSGTDITGVTGIDILQVGVLAPGVDDTLRAPDVVVVEGQLAAQLHPYEPTRGVAHFDGDQRDKIEAGDVLVAGVIRFKAEHGFARRVTSISYSAGLTTAYTIQVPLTDVFRQVNFHAGIAGLDEPLPASPVAAAFAAGPGVDVGEGQLWEFSAEAGTDPPIDIPTGLEGLTAQLDLQASVSGKAGFAIIIRLNDGLDINPRVTNFVAGTRGEVEVSATLSASGAWTHDWTAPNPLFERNLATFWGVIGGVPVVVSASVTGTPVAGFDLTAAGSVTAEAGASARAKYLFEEGTDPDDDWISEFGFNGPTIPDPEFSAEAELRVGIENELRILLYHSVGPTATVEPFLRGTAVFGAGQDLELAVDICANLSVGLHGQIPLFDVEFGDFDVGLNDEPLCHELWTNAGEPGTFEVTVNELPTAPLGDAYGFLLSATKPDATWELTAGTLPDGIILTPDGRLWGTPTDVGEATFDVTATDPATSQTATATLSIDVRRMSGGVTSWVDQSGGTARDETTGVAIAPDGSIWELRVVDSGSGTLTLAHRNPDGTETQTLHIGSDSRGGRVTTDGAGNVYVAATVDGWRVQVSKFNPSGVEQWSIVRGETFSPNSVADIKVGIDGSIYLAGMTSSSSWLAQYDGDGYVMKLDNDGNELWAQAMGHPTGSYAEVLGMDIDIAGNVYVGGEGAVTAAGVGMIWPHYALRLDENGVRGWVHEWSAPAEGSYTERQPRDIAVGTGGLTVTIVGESWVDSNGTALLPWTTGGPLPWVLEVDASTGEPEAEVIYDNLVGAFGTGNHGFTVAAASQDGNIFVSGMLNSDMLVAQITTSGHLIWHDAIGSDTYDNGVDVAAREFGPTDANGDGLSDTVVVAGYTQGDFSSPFGGITDSITLAFDSFGGALERKVHVSRAAARQILIDGNLPSDKLDSYLDSFDGPIFSVQVEPGEIFLRHANSTNPGQIGSFFTRFVYTDPQAAAAGLALPPANDASHRQETLVEDPAIPQELLMLYGGIAGSDIGDRQWVVTTWTVAPDEPSFHYGELILYDDGWPSYPN